MRALVVLLLLARVAAADDKPWAKGVPADRQEQALAIYKDANAQFEQDDFKDALPKYREALKLWDHPAIHYNAAVCLINLDQPVEAYDELQKAMAYGEAPLGHALYQQGKTYLAALKESLAVLEVSCTQSGAVITLDGSNLLTSCPAGTTRRLDARHQHELVATKSGYKPERLSVELRGGQTTTMKIVLEPLPNKRLVRRWDQRVPWTVIGGGAAIALAGFIPFSAARTHIDSFDRAVSRDCPSGCPTSAYPGLLALESKGHTDFNIARGMWIGGGAIAAVGFALVVLNQPHLEHAPVVAPDVGPGRVGAIISGRW